MAKSNNYASAKELINTLEENKFYIVCPCGCGEEVLLKNAGLFYLDDFTKNAKEIISEMEKELKERAIRLNDERKSISKKSQVTAKAVNIGFILERIAPAFKNFPYEHLDSRALFDPIDYIIFDGLHKSGKVERIIFSDVKTGGAKLNKSQKEIKSLINNKKVEFQTY